MTSKYFGEFLVEKGVITEEGLVDALIEQIAGTPPLCQVVYTKKIIPTEKIFEAFRFQQDHQVEFMQACTAIGVWTKDVQEKVYFALDEIRRPLGHILVKKGLIDLKILTTMLDEFLSQLSATPTAPSILEVPSNSVTQEKPQKVVVDTGDMVDFLQPGILMELEETFDEKKRKIVKAALLLIKDNAAGDEAICKKLFQDVFKIVHGLNGLLGFLALEKLSELLSDMEVSLNRILSQLPDRAHEQIVKDSQLLVKSIDLAWSLRTSIMEHSTEKNFFDEKSNQQSFIEITNDLKG